MVEWWEPDTKKKYLEKAKCIIEQYGNYTEEETGMHVSSNPHRCTVKLTNYLCKITMKMYTEVGVQHHTFLNLKLALLQGRRPQYLMDRRLSRPYSSQSEASCSKKKTHCQESNSDCLSFYIILTVVHHVWHNLIFRLVYPILKIKQKHKVCHTGLVLVFGPKLFIESLLDQRFRITFPICPN